MDNGMESMLDTYLFETNSLLDNLDEMLVKDEKLGDFSPDDVNEIFRIMHTIKGSSAMMEFGSLSSIAHHIEDLFFYIRDKGIDSLSSQHKKELFNLMFRSEDCLRGQVEKVENGEPLDTDMDTFASEINDFLKKISSGFDDDSAEKVEGKNAAPANAGSAASSPAAEKPLSAEHLPADNNAVCFLHVFLDEGIGMENLRAFMIINALKECELDFRYYPENMESNPDTCATIIEDGFYLAFESEEMAAKAETNLCTQNHIRSYQLVSLSDLTQESAQTAPASSGPVPAAPVDNAVPQQAEAPKKPQPPAPPKPPVQNAPVKQNLISVNLTKLDSLMNIVGEIVITESMVTSSPELGQLSRDAYDNFMKSARQLRKLTDDLQDISMSLRMVSISGTFQKMNRIVRDMKKALNKDVRLTIIGEDTEIDKTIVDSISDPIMHIVRNSMDHGIETSKEERIAAGKDPQGELILSASHTGSEVIISISDDGQGMDTEKILAKAARNGLLTKPESEYSKKEILSLLMLPGFSTNEEVTEFSGRGVGMDVVKKNVESVGGTISITSEVGQGSCTTLKIPLTMAIVDGMEIRVGKTIFTIPISNIRQSIKIARENVLHDAKGNEIVKIMDEFYPIIRLHEFYNIEPELTNIEDGILIWVEAGDHSYCMFVDELLGERQIVVKPFPSYLSNFNIKDYGISGCTILGDGNISIILEVVNLYNAANV